MIKKIAVLTSGGDAPGMNAAIRGVVRAALAEGLEVFGIYDGYQGLYNNKIKQLNRYSVSDVINRGGTFLGSARFPEFKDPAVREKCAEILRSHGIDALVVIGGDGSYMGAKLLTEEHGFPCVGIPGTIDNDVAGTDYTIGYETALQTAVDAIDRLRDTSSSHQRISIVEIMGRHCSDLTISAGIAGGCEYIVASEVESYLRYQGDKFVGRFDANTYLLMTKALDYFDPAADYGHNLTCAVENAQAKFFVASFSTDWRFSPQRSHELVKALIAAQKSVQYIEVKSNHGHDAFLMEDEAYIRAVAAYMNNVYKDCQQ